MRENLLDCNGVKFTAEIEGTYVSGKIRVEDCCVYLCQNEMSGANCSDKLGYESSWSVMRGSAIDLKDHCVSNFNIIEEKNCYSGLTKISGKWAVYSGLDIEEFTQVMIKYCDVFHPGYCYDFDNTECYYGWDGEDMQCGWNPKALNIAIYTLEEFKQIINYNLKTKTNEKSNSVKVQRKTPNVSNGERFTGISVSGRTSKIAVKLGHLSYSAISNECF